MGRRLTDVGAAIQQACQEQKRKDLFETVHCQSCGGLGIVADLANRFYQCPGMCTEPRGGCPDCEMVYGGKRCGECGGLGWVRHDAAGGSDPA